MTDKNISSSSNTSKNKTFDLQSVAAELESWRRNKKFSSEPIPQTIKEKIYHLVNSNQDKISQISKTLLISRSHIKAIENSIKTEIAKKNVTSKSLSTKPHHLNLELLPFEVLPKKNINEDSKKNDINCQSNVEVNNNNSLSSSNNILITDFHVKELV